MQSLHTSFHFFFPLPPFSWITFLPFHFLSAWMTSFQKSESEGISLFLYFYNLQSLSDFFPSFSFRKESLNTSRKLLKCRINLRAQPQRAGRGGREREEDSQRDRRKVQFPLTHWREAIKFCHVANFCHEPGSRVMTVISPIFSKFSYKFVLPLYSQRHPRRSSLFFNLSAAYRQ